MKFLYDPKNTAKSISGKYILWEARFWKYLYKTNSPIKFLAFFNHEHMLRDKISSLSCRSNCDLQTEENG